MQAFSFCNSLINIAVDENNPEYKSIDGVLYSKDGEKLILCPAGKASVEISNSVTSIGLAAFSGCNNITNLILPSGISKIEEGAFNNCCSLISIEIPESVTSFDAVILYGCNSLKNITYNGTKEQWCKINKGVHWDFDTDNYTIFCTDGTIEKQ